MGEESGSETNGNEDFRRVSSGKLEVRKRREVRVRFYLISFSREESPSPLHLTHREEETREIRTWHLDCQGKINPADCAE